MTDGRYHGLEGLLGEGAGGNGASDAPREPRAGETWYDDKGPVLILGDPFDHRIGRVVSGRRWSVADSRKGTVGNMLLVASLSPTGSAETDADRIVEVDEQGNRHVTFVCELPDFLQQGVTILKRSG